MAGNAKKAVVGLGHFIYGWGFVQIALIGMAYFNAIPRTVHGTGGLLLTLAALLLLVAAALARLGGRAIGLAALVFVILIMQGYFVHTPDLAPVVQGLHPIFGLAVMFMGRYLAGQAKAAA